MSIYKINYSFTCDSDSYKYGYISETEFNVPKTVFVESNDKFELEHYARISTFRYNLKMILNYRDNSYNKEFHGQLYNTFSKKYYNENDGLYPILYSHSIEDELLRLFKNKETILNNFEMLFNPSCDKKFLYKEHVEDFVKLIMKLMYITEFKDSDPEKRFWREYSIESVSFTDSEPEEVIDLSQEEIPDIEKYKMFLDKGDKIDLAELEYFSDSD